ncbi:hypothetical protein V496_00245 [Pseudogymnoascus sp. VKM F-4515 (FW-2607)]|nr:hypothetical protein V496_00245 [Pseudogymnoascus sp. VKM F-4515 (FW-2607)]KFY70417.1 hypothetical protein V498_10353 [Pseudogymnoascus sp. VKM F-4517 (FW-2822)]
MGTRHLICVFYRGRFVIAQYGQFDGNPENQGFKVVAFLNGASNIARLKQGLTHTYTPSDEEIDEIGRAMVKQDEEHRDAVRNGEVGMWEQVKLSCPSMSRETSAEILEVVAKTTAEAPVPIVHELEFIHDGLYCEWAYVVDLDAEVLEVYREVERGHEGSSQRFKDVDGAGMGLVPSLVKAFAFGELPKENVDFVAAINEALDSLRREILAREGREDAGNNAVA